MEHIYPTCPECGNHASGGNGVTLRTLPQFTWYCPDCQHIHEGEFYPGDTEVAWTDSRAATARDRLAHKIRSRF